MLYNEARWLARVLERYSMGDLSPLINIASGDRIFREEVQPHIDELIFKPLRIRNIKVIHFDLKDEIGVDIRGDIFNDGDVQKLKRIEPKSAICSNMMEHVLYPHELAKRCFSLIPKGGLLFVTVPLSYPYHADPIDTMFRPRPQELAELFKPFKIIASEIVTGGSYRDEVRKRPWIMFRHIFRFPFPFVKFERWKRSMRKLYWLFHDYKVTCIVVKKEV